MNPILKRLSPYLLILIGLFMLFWMGMPVAAGVLLLIGYVMIVERIWPEEWKADRQK